MSETVTIEVQMPDDLPIVDCRRVHHDGYDTFEFACPHCWTFGDARGVDDTVVWGRYKKRPQRAKAKVHTHGAEEGHRHAHCIQGSPFQDRGYILREIT